MIFDLEKLDQGEWFPFFSSRINEQGEVVYDDPDPEAGRVCIRSMAPKLRELQAGKKRKSEFVLNPQTRSMERVTFFEEISQEQAKQERDAIWDYIIVDFYGLLDAKGKPIECNRENKLKLMQIPIFDRYIARCLQLLSGAGVKASEELEKN